MNSFRTVYDHHAFVLWLIALLMVVLLGLWMVPTKLQIRRLQARMDSIFEGVSGEQTATMLVEYLDTVRGTANDVARMKAEHDQIAALLPSVLRHVGLVRFSPFHDTGGDQSFALALLDGKCDGVVVTALHSRADSRLYAKPVQRGESSYALTPEEREAMERAVESNGVRPTSVSLG